MLATLDVRVGTVPSALDPPFPPKEPGSKPERAVEAERSWLFFSLSTREQVMPSTGDAAVGLSAPPLLTMWACLVLATPLATAYTPPCECISHLS